MNNFQQDLTSLLNHHSKDNEAGIPDYILAQYLDMCLHNLVMTLKFQEAHKQGLFGNPSKFFDSPLGTPFNPCPPIPNTIDPMPPEPYITSETNDGKVKVKAG
jgi:hypothetical protein